MFKLLLVLMLTGCVKERIEPTEQIKIESTGRLGIDGIKYSTCIGIGRPVSMEDLKKQLIVFEGHTVSMYDLLFIIAPERFKQHK